MTYVNCTYSVNIDFVKTNILFHVRRLLMWEIYSDTDVVRLEISLSILTCGLDNSESVNFDTTEGKNINTSIKFRKCVLHILSGLQ